MRHVPQLALSASLAADLRTEKDLQREVWQLLKKCGCKSYWLSQMRRTQQTKGVPDLLTFHSRRGQAWIETKHPTNTGSKQTPEQAEFEQQCLATGQTYLLVIDAQQVANWLAGVNSESWSATARRCVKS